MKTSLCIFLAILGIISCENNKMQTADSRLTLTRSATEYASAVNGTRENKGDPFTLRDFEIKGDSAFLTISYSGGCNEHTFEIIWSEFYTKTYPPGTGIFVVHNAHGDACKALITETLSFNIVKLTGPIDYESVNVTLHSGNPPSASSLTAIWYPSDINVYNVIFPEGDQCQVEVTAASAICGAGLWDNLWFALNDSINAGIQGSYFKKWLQPVAVVEDLKNFRPVAGKKYLVGARIQKDHPFNNVVICMAYPGPSVPVKITCVTELK